MPRIIGRNLLLEAPFSKSGYRFCVRMRLEPRARALSLCQPVHVSLIAISSVPEMRPFMPRDNDKNNDSRGRRDRPVAAARAAPAPPGGRRRNSPSAVLPARARARGAPMPASPTAPDRMARSPMRAPANPTPASAKGPRRAATGTHRGLAAMTVRRRKATLHPARRPPELHRDDRVRAARSARTPRARSRRCPPGRAISDRKFGDKKPYASREGGGEKRPYTPRGEGFRKDGDRPAGRSPLSARGRRATATVPAAIVPSENLAATRNFPAARRTEVRARIS